ncbi:hypothetical protein CBL_07067 [Carabus blaptoides fortunei]
MSRPSIQVHDIAISVQVEYTVEKERESQIRIIHIRFKSIGTAGRCSRVTVCHQRPHAEEEETVRGELGNERLVWCELMCLSTWQTSKPTYIRTTAKETASMPAASLSLKEQRGYRKDSLQRWEADEDGWSRKPYRRIMCTEDLVGRYSGAGREIESERRDLVGLRGTLRDSEHALAASTQQTNSRPSDKLTLVVC